jgi:hypothetical protein
MKKHALGKVSFLIALKEIDLLNLYQVRCVAIRCESSSIVCHSYQLAKQPEREISQCGSGSGAANIFY